MKPDITFFYVGEWNKEIVNLLVPIFQNQYNINEKNINDFNLLDDYIKTNKEHDLLRCVVIQLEDYFFILDFDDLCKITRPKEFCKHPKCKKILKSQFYKDEKSYKQLGIQEKIFEYTYFPRLPSVYYKLQPEMLKIEKNENNSDKLYFRGKRTYRTELLEKLISQNIITTFCTERLELEDYYKESAKQKIALSLPGHGNFTHREIECFGFGVPVIMPKLLNSYHNKLIPNFHYISIETSITASNLDDSVLRIKNRFNEVKHDLDFQNFVKENALKWYYENIHYPNCAVLTKKLLEI